MKKLHLLLFLVFLTPFVSGCEVIGDIFKAGVWVGVIAVFLVIGLVIYLISKFRG